MTTSTSKIALSTSPAVAPDPETVPVGEFADRTKLGRTLLYKAMSPDPAYRGELPFLPSLKVGRCRRIRLETGRHWLRELEAKTGEGEGRDAS